MKRLLKIFKFLFALAFLGAALAFAGAMGLYSYYQAELPSVEKLKEIRYQVPLRVYSAEGLLIGEFGEHRRDPVEYDQIPEKMIQAFLAAEDDSFFHHPGIDIKGLARAGITLALTGEKRQGGSTITMQVARNFFFSREKTFERKFKEILLAIQIEKELSKEDIITLYLNKIFLGQRAYGVSAAAQIYYGSDLQGLTLAQTAMIAGLPKAPSTNNPVSNPDNAITRRNYVLARMLELDYIDNTRYQEAIATPITAKVHHTTLDFEAPYVAEMVREHLVNQYGEEATYEDGFSVYTTIKTHLQIAADQALKKALDDYERRHGYRGPIEQLETLPQNAQELENALSKHPSFAQFSPALVSQIEDKAAIVCLADTTTLRLPWTALKWARKHISTDRQGFNPKKASDFLTVGDIVYVQNFEIDDQPHWRLANAPQVAGALVSLNPEDGAILALTGGYDFAESKFNRVLQAERQPGSGFKAFIYSAALDAGFTPASIINDAPVVINDASLEGAWRPKNYSGKVFGPTRLRYGLTKSRNLISIRLVRSVGIEHTLKHIGKFGFDITKLPRNFSIALGSGVVTPLQMARGYAVLANGGFLIDPYFIQRIERDGKVLFQAKPQIACAQCEARRARDQALAAEETNPLVAQTGVSQADNAVEEAMADSTLEKSADNESLLAPRVISPENRFLMYSMMQDVITRGTATKARVLKRSDLAGKTGTTNEQRDAWFNGYNQHYATIAWVGYDSNDKLGRGEVGGRAALPAWIDYMRVALQDYPNQPPVPPESLVTVRIDPKTGKRAPANQKNAIFEYFRPGNVPETAAHKTIIAPVGAAPAQSGAEKPAVVEELF